jgi:hypothetical protein
MKTIYIVFYKNQMVFAFNSRDEAETYIQRAIQNGMEVGVKYSHETLYYRSVDLLEGE